MVTTLPPLFVAFESWLAGDWNLAGWRFESWPGSDWNLGGGQIGILLAGWMTGFPSHGNPSRETETALLHTFIKIAIPAVITPIEAEILARRCRRRRRRRLLGVLRVLLSLEVSRLV